MAAYPVQPARRSYDVVVVGGAMLGASVAWFLADNPDFGGTVLVVERDPSYVNSATAHTNSCMRQQFSTAINVRVSQFAADYVKNFRTYMGDDPRVSDVAFESFGYMYLAGSEGAAARLRAAQALQAGCGAGTRYLDRAQIAADYPFYNLEDIVGGTHNLVDEGYFDGNTLFDWWRRKARERGVEFIANEVVDLVMDSTGKAVHAATLKTGEEIACGTLVNASGPRAAKVAAMAGIDLPVEPRKRYTFVFAARTPLDRPLPLTIDPSGVHVRSDGAYYMAGCPPEKDGPVAADDFAADNSIWEDRVWPALAHRIPQFDALRLINSWVGHYDYNTLDQNAVVGPHDRVSNFLFVNGFSGHGFQQAPAMGRGLSEWITCGAYRSLDLSPFGYDRIREGRPFTEDAVI